MYLKFGHQKMMFLLFSAFYSKQIFHTNLQRLLFYTYLNLATLSLTTTSCPLPPLKFSRFIE